ncbi:nitroreductase family protein [Cellulosilyticum sp. ST5]|uniref:nitroreductase family protein n=1 Tax=Cellulosilyticum sp. ST5 TaxID=3055805 RepID=UPI00397738CD
MDFFEVVHKRRTIRDFENKQIKDEDIKKIIEAGFCAPTNDHMRDWNFIVIKDKKTVITLLDIVPKGISEEDMSNLIRDWNLNDNEQQACYRDAVPKQYRMLADASVIIIPLFKQKTKILSADNLSQLNGFASIWCCIENIFLAATAMNYGCNLRIPLGNEDEWSKKILGYPDEYMMPCFIGIGQAQKDAVTVRQKTIDIDERIHWNSWI